MRVEIGYEKVVKQKTDRMRGYGIRNTYMACYIGMP